LKSTACAFKVGCKSFEEGCNPFDEPGKSIDILAYPDGKIIK